MANSSCGLLNAIRSRASRISEPTTRAGFLRLARISNTSVRYSSWLERPDLSRLSASYNTRARKRYVDKFIWSKRSSIRLAGTVSSPTFRQPCRSSRSGLEPAERVVQHRRAKEIRGQVHLVEALEHPARRNGFLSNLQATLPLLPIRT